jgi:drug/metabolite transporter (DMT)-like permease
MTLTLWGAARPKRQSYRFVCARFCCAHITTYAALRCSNNQRIPPQPSEMSTDPRNTARPPNTPPRFFAGQCLNKNPYLQVRARQKSIPHPMQHTPSKSIVLIAISTIAAFGFSWPIMKLALPDIPPIWLGMLRLGVATIVLFVILICSRRKFWPTYQDIPLIFSVGLLQMGVFVVLIGMGLQHVEAGRSAILVYTTPLWVTPIAILIFKESFHTLTLVGLGIGVMGMLCLFNPLSFNWQDSAALQGNALLLMASLAWACVILHLRFGKQTRSALELLPWQMLLATVFLCIAGYLLEPAPVIHWSTSLLMKLAYISLFATAFAYWGAIEVSRRLPAVTTSLVFLAVPVIGLISSAYILGERITLNISIAVVLLLAGLCCVVIAKRIASVPTE